jgi:tetratricopeptide (TPR) repeat protein
MAGPFRIRELLASVTIVLLGALPLAARSAVPADQHSPAAEIATCAAIPPPGSIVFHGRTLIDAPDLPADLRRANALWTAGCYDEAAGLLTEYVNSHPNDYRAYFLSARMRWNMGQEPMAEAMLNTLLKAHPHFVSAMVLLASMRLGAHEYDEAQKLLDQVEKLQPTNLWGYIDELRLEAALTPSASTVKTMREILADPQFPKLVHQTVLQIAEYEMPGLSQEQRDAFFRQAMTDMSCDACALADKAEDIIELRHEPKAGADLIETYLKKCGGCVATARVRTLLAEAYLMEAVKIAPAPSEANAKLVRDAKAALGGDLTLIAHRAAAAPFLTPVIPFLNGAVDHVSADDSGQTVICDAVIYLNPKLVTEELAGGADPNGSCEQTSLLLRVLYVATDKHVSERQSIVRALLERGARVQGVPFCSGSGGDCSKVLLPILKQFQEQRAKETRTL